MERCAVCEFAWESVGEDEVGDRIRAGAAATAGVLTGAPDASVVRPAAQRWSTLEYAAHVRDVCLHVRDRLAVAIVEDDPGFMRLHPDARVDLGLYAGDDPETVAAELVTAADLFARTFDRLAPDQLDRPCQYLYPTPQTRSVRWMGQQVVHEVEHHLGDIRENAAAPG